MSYDPRSKYGMGRGMAALEDSKLEHYDTPEAEPIVERIKALTAEIEAAGGWDDEAQRGYNAARREYAEEANRR